MNGRFKFALTGLAVLSIAACATTPQHRYASSVKAAQAAGRPLVIYGLDSDYGWLSGSQRKSGPVYYVGVAFINSDPRPLQKLTFTLSADFDYKPVLNADGTPLQIDLSAAGPFAPGTASAIVASLSPTKTESDALAGACLRLDSIQMTYQDHSTLKVAAPLARAYLTPQMKPRAICVHYPAWAERRSGVPDRIYYPPMPPVISRWSLPDPPIPSTSGGGTGSGPSVSKGIH